MLLTHAKEGSSATMKVVCIPLSLNYCCRVLCQLEPSILRRETMLSYRMSFLQVYCLIMSQWTNTEVRLSVKCMTLLSVVVTVMVCALIHSLCLVTFSVTIHHASIWLSDVFQMILYGIDGTQCNTLCCMACRSIRYICSFCS